MARFAIITTAFVIILASLFAGAANSYASIDINGDLSDWGVTPGPYGASDWIPSSGILYTEEDQNTWYLNPGWGGQKYDAEAIYYKKEDGMVYVAIVTGHPATGYGTHVPCDIAFDYDKDGVYEYSLKTYGSDKAGEFYKDLTASSWSGYSTKSGSGTYMGDVGFVYAHTYFDATGLDTLNDHWVIEAGIPESYFAGGWKDEVNIRWTMSCGNDQIYLVATPEPASMTLLGLGIAGLLRLRKRKVINRP